MAVIAILGVLLFVVVPNLDNVTPTARLKSAARKIGTTMELAQGQAIATGKEYTLAYDLSSGKFKLLAPPPDPNNPNGTTTTTGTGTGTGTGTNTANGATAAQSTFFQTVPAQDQTQNTPPPPDVESDAKPPLWQGSSSGSGSTPGTPSTTPPLASTSSSSQNNMQNREVVMDDAVSDDIQIVSVTTPSGQQQTSGVVYINFSSLGNEGSHIVQVQTKNTNGGSFATTTGTPVSVRFNALTRTVDFADGPLSWSSTGGN
jgi:Tfp pilus assembly protein FimT